MLKRLDDADLYLGDCVDVLKTLPDNSVDLTVTSPPYDNLRTYSDTLVWDFDVFKQVAEQLYRITKQGGVVVWVVGDATIKGSETGTSFRQALYFKEIGFNLHDTMIYRKVNPMPVAHNRYLPCFEYMFILAKGKPNTFNPIKTKTTSTGVERYTGTQQENGKFTAHGKSRNLERFLYNVWDFKVGSNQSTKDNIAFNHPAIFPEQLANDHIISWSNVGDTVLDPFMGSATTGKMALLNSRKFIGIEKVPEYFQICIDRINQTQEKHNATNH